MRALLPTSAAAEEAAAAGQWKFGPMRLTTLAVLLAAEGRAGMDILRLLA
jgi:hypothetical protein